MKVYDVWCSEFWRYDGWISIYGDAFDNLVSFLENLFPGTDWIIIENDLPF